MVKRIQQVVSLLLALLLLCGTVLATDNSNNYTSPYYSDTQNLEENIVIDRLYEYGLRCSNKLVFLHCNESCYWFRPLNKIERSNNTPIGNINI